MTSRIADLVEGTAVPRLPEGLDTPSLVVDLDVVESNARRLAESLAERGVRLRPHVKTHKSIGLARIQIAHGAVGLTVGTLGEAEVFAAAAFDDLFVAFPVWAVGPKAIRLRAVHETVRLSVGVDSIDGAQRLAEAVAGSDHRLAVVIELDSGDRRTGVPSAEEAVALAIAARHLGLEVAGVFTHGGHGYASSASRASAAADEVRVLGEAADALRSYGFEVGVVSAGSTPTMIDAASGQVNEIRAGTYLLGDRQQSVLGAIPADAVALHVAATVVSIHAPYVYIDAGAKALTKDVPTIVKGFGLLPAYPAARIERLMDYHGVIRIPEGTLAPHLGEVVAVVPNHVCPVVDLFDAFVVTRGGLAIDAWQVDARGRSG